MRLIREASFEEFARHYLGRERAKLGLAFDPHDTADRTEEMRRFHPAKLRPWFESARWNLVLIDEIEEAMTLVCLDSPETRKAGLVNGRDPDNRTAGRVVAAALEVGLFEEARVGVSECNREFRKKRSAALALNWPALGGQEKLVLCSLNDDERSENPRGTWYLHDGFGRLVPYLYGALYEGRMFAPIEALLAEER